VEQARSTRRTCEILGAPRFENEVAMRTSVPGVATGLAWTPVGGDILFIEATRMPGKGKLILTGQLGDVMKESAQAALSLVKSQSEALGLDPTLFEKSDIHVHVPAGAIPKDGPSAGVAMYTALVSLLTGRTVRNDVAMTGEISLRGLVLPVGGIKEKTVAAHRAGIRTVLLPARNRKDLEDIPESVRKEMLVDAVGVPQLLLPTDPQPTAHSLSPIPYPVPPPRRYSRSSKLITHCGRYTTAMAMTMPFTKASPKLMSGSTAKYSGPTCAASRDPLAASSDARQAGEVVGERRAREHGDEEIDEVVVRQARVHELVQPRGHERRHDHHAEQVGAEAAPRATARRREHRERHRAADHGELPAVHQRERGHHQEAQRQPRADAGLHRPHAHQQAEAHQPDPLALAVLEPDAPGRAECCEREHDAR
jgi:hypothetical protein